MNFPFSINFFRKQFKDLFWFVSFSGSTLIRIQDHLTIKLISKYKCSYYLPIYPFTKKSKNIHQYFLLIPRHINKLESQGKQNLGRFAKLWIFKKAWGSWIGAPGFRLSQKYMFQQCRWRECWVETVKFFYCVRLKEGI